MIRCPKCDQEMEHEEAEPDVNIRGGWACNECEEFVPDEDVDDEAQMKTDEATTASRVPIITDLKTRVAALEVKTGITPG